MFWRKRKLEKTGKMRSAKQLGMIVGLSAKEVNAILRKKGYLSGKPGAYNITSKGELYSEVRGNSNGYGGYAAKSWEFIMWDSCMIYELSNDKYPGIDWYCDQCNAFLNVQKGFKDRKRHWKCKECGYKNLISKEGIVAE